MAQAVDFKLLYNFPPVLIRLTCLTTKYWSAYILQKLDHDHDSSTLFHCVHLLKIIILASIYLSQYNIFLPLHLLIQPRMSPTDRLLWVMLLYSWSACSRIYAIWNKSRLNLDQFPHLHMRQVKCLKQNAQGASFFNPEQTSQYDEKIWDQNLVCHRQVMN